MTESPKPGRRAISLKEKLRIIQRIEKGEKQSAIARDLNLSKSTVNTIWKSRGKFKERIESQDFRNEAKRLRLAKQRDVDQALSEWFKEVSECRPRSPRLCFVHVAASLPLPFWRATLPNFGSGASTVQQYIPGLCVPAV